jgi:restriction system protein
LTAASQFVRFANELKPGDRVVTYNPSQRRYVLGTIEGDIRQTHQVEGENWYSRPVKWQQRCERDLLTKGSRNTLGAIQALFRVSEEAASDLYAKAMPIDAPDAELPAVGPVTRGSEVELDDAYAEIVSKSHDLIEDLIAALNADQMEQLVAGVLRAMGYKARVSPKGGDRGVDIFASRDGLGLEEPRIFVEVKHRIGTKISAPEIRAFLGGRKPGDRCLYVSTGGFAKDARYEAERSNVPLTLIDLPLLRELLVEHYDALGEETRRLMPLTRVYWPAPNDG